jgi:ABC-2 type transport system permease protein
MMMATCAELSQRDRRRAPEPHSRRLTMEKKGDSVADATTGPSVPVPTMLAVVRKYYNIYRVSLIERLAYRGDFLLGTVLRFFPVMTTILLWRAVFAGARGEGEERLAGFTEREMIAYLLLIHISRMFSSMPGLAAGISRDIRDGSLKKYLIQPLDMIGYLLSYRAAHKTAYIATSFIPYAALFWICSGYFDGWPDALTMAAYLFSLILGFLIGFFFETAMGITGFWFLQVTSLLWVVNTLNYFVSGQMFPLELLDGWAPWLRLLPFKYLAYFPAMIFLGKIQGPRLGQELLIACAWVVIMILVARWLYVRGLRRYSAYGG